MVASRAILSPTWNFDAMGLPPRLTSRTTSGLFQQGASTPRREPPVYPREMGRAGDEQNAKSNPPWLAELSADHISGGQSRHGSRLLRWRTDKSPEDCTMDQMPPTGP